MGGERDKLRDGQGEEHSYRHLTMQEYYSRTVV